jgi:hypothetical protein
MILATVLFDISFVEFSGETRNMYRYLTRNFKENGNMKNQEEGERIMLQFDIQKWLNWFQMDSKGLVLQHGSAPPLLRGEATDSKIAFRLLHHATDHTIITPLSNPRHGPENSNNAQHKLLNC